jgi:hypothetical protein
MNGDMPPAQGRTWTAVDYAARDARLAQLGIVLTSRQAPQ